MAQLIAAYQTGITGTYFRARRGSDGYWWNTGTLAWEAWNGSNVANYAISATENGTSSIFAATVPAQWTAGTYQILFFDPAISSNPLGSDQFSYSGDFEITDQVNYGAVVASGEQVLTELLNTQNHLDASIVATQEALETELSDLQDHGDENWVGDAAGGSGRVVPVYVQLGTGEVLWNEIKAYQFAEFGPFTFQLYDSQKPPQPINVNGHDITFICSEQDGTHLWQIEECLVLGTYSNLVKVEADDANMEDAGNFKYVLRDVTDDRVLAVGRLVIEAAADAE